MSTERRKGLSKGQKVWLSRILWLSRPEMKDAEGVVVSSYMENKYARYVIRTEFGLIHGLASDFLTENPNLGLVV